MPFAEVSYFPGIGRTQSVTGIAGGTESFSIPLLDFNAGFHIRIPIPKSRIIPYAVVSVGGIHTPQRNVTASIPDPVKPGPILPVPPFQVNASTDFAVSGGAGLRYYATERLGFRVEFKAYRPTGTYTKPVLQGRRRLLLSVLTQLEVSTDATTQRNPVWLSSFASSRWSRGRNTEVLVASVERTSRTTPVLSACWASRIDDRPYGRVRRGVVEIVGPLPSIPYHVEQIETISGAEPPHRNRLNERPFQLRIGFERIRQSRIELIAPWVLQVRPAAARGIFPLRFRWQASTNPLAVRLRVIPTHPRNRQVGPAQFRIRLSLLRFTMARPTREPLIGLGCNLGPGNPETTRYSYLMLWLLVWETETVVRNTSYLKRPWRNPRINKAILGVLPILPGFTSSKGVTTLCGDGGVGSVKKKLSTGACITNGICLPPASRSTSD